jgi:hypothetical protein
MRVETKRYLVSRTIAFGVTLFALSAAPLAAQAGDAGDRQLIGFAGPATNGKFSVLVYNNQCAVAHPGRSAHMCTSKEIFANALDIGDFFPEVGFWVHPNVVGVAQLTDADGVERVRYRDYSGVHGSAFIGSPLTTHPGVDGLSCSAWSSDSNAGTGLSFNGSFQLAPCNEAKFVACCGVKCERDCAPARGVSFTPPSKGLCCRFTGSAGAPQCGDFATCDECIAAGGQCSDGACNPSTGRCEASR